MKPRLVFSPLGRRVYVVTRYTIRRDTLIAQRKYDVTDDFVRLRRMRLRLSGAAATPHTESK